MGKEFTIISMVTFMKENLLMIRELEKENFNSVMEAQLLVSL